MQKKHRMEIQKHEQVAPNVYRLQLAGSIYAKPGQFVQVGVSATHDPFLFRPLSVHNCTENTLSLLYRAAGRGTGLLAQKSVGDTLLVVGPLGNGFSVGSTRGEKREVIVVAGGIGAAPLYYLLHAMKKAGCKVDFFYGAKTASELMLPDEYKQAAHVYAESTDDGTRGKHGLVTELVKDALAKQPRDIYACGPEPMLRSVARLAKEFCCRCYVSLEAKMACGVGACLGCVIPAADGEYRRVCVDGPVFRAEEVFVD